MSEAALREAVEHVFSKYGDALGGRDGIVPVDAIIKHAAKAAGQHGTPGNKKQRQAAIKDYIERARLARSPVKRGFKLLQLLSSMLQQL